MDSSVIKLEQKLYRLVSFMKEFDKCLVTVSVTDIATWRCKEYFMKY